MTTTFAVGDIEVRRLGFGAMRITGAGTWGPPRDRAAARALLRRAVDLGVQLIDTADAYGPGALPGTRWRPVLAPRAGACSVKLAGGVIRAAGST